MGTFRTATSLALSGILLSFLSSSNLALAFDPSTSDSDLESELLAFDQDPETYMSQHLKRFDPQTGEILTPEPFFSEDEIKSKDFILHKDMFQQTSPLYQQEGRASIRRNDRPENLVDKMRWVTLEEMESSNARSSQLEHSPWSDDYWPVYTLGIAKRYADAKFPRSRNWGINRNYIFKNSCSIDNLSPAEKYDLLVGDSNWTLTKFNANEGQRYGGGYVQPWMGKCHGWASASFMLSRPAHVITLTAADGRTQIPFYPSDIKALATALWANSSPRTRFIGGRCNTKNPQTDRNGRVLDSKCFDTNPGTWHLSVVNQIAGSGRSFVMDSTYDYEVWNQPIFSYHYRYFNPVTRKAVRTLQEAIIPIQSFSNDRFSTYRSSRAAYVVGVSMKVVYTKEVAPTHHRTDSQERDYHVAVNYLYDLELDSNKRIIGGEWYNNEHPDFLYVAPLQSRALTYLDHHLIQQKDIWEAGTRMSSSYRNAAQRASAIGSPLGLIVEELIFRASVGS